MRSWVAAMVAVVPLLALGACSSSSEPAVLTTATSFQQALAAGDHPAACGLLSSEARARLESASARPCADAMARLTLPTGEVRSTEVWGGEAQVRLASQVLFLAEFRDGWRVTAAGCSPRSEQPYACLVRA